jgi:fumarate hydratase subunit beta
MTYKFTTPLTKQDISKLKVGDKVLLSGTIFTARDKAHLYLLKNNFSKIKNSVIYHCGPIIKNKKVIAAGPTTSARMNPYTPQLIKKYAIRAIIGKGGMDDNVLRAMKGKAVYFSAVGGAAVLYAKAIKVKGIDKPEFGMPEAIWELEVKDFPVIVSMDAKGNSLYKEVERKSKKIFNSLIKVYY